MGFAQASRMFPCRAEGFDTGCEWYKTLPTFVAANAAAYLSVAFVGGLQDHATGLTSRENRRAPNQMNILDVTVLTSFSAEENYASRMNRTFFITSVTAQRRTLFSRTATSVGSSTRMR